MYPSSNLSPTTSRYPIEAKLEGKSDTGLSPPNSNFTAIQSLELRLIYPTRDSEALCNTPTYNKQSKLTLPNNPCLCHPSFHSTPASPSTNTSSISNYKTIYMHPSFSFSPTTSRFPIEAEWEGKSDTGLSPPNYNDKATPNLEFWLTPPTRDSASLCRTHQNNTSPHLELRLAPPRRDSASLSSNLCVTASNISNKSRQKIELSLSLTYKTRLKTILSYLDPVLYFRSSKISTLILS